MNAILSLSACALTGSLAFVADSSSVPVSTPSPVVYVQLQDPENVEPLLECHCVASTKAMTGSDTVIECSGEGATNGSLFITSPVPATNAPCDVANGQCATKEGSKCRATVKATVLWPSGCCGSVAVIGPTIGTTAQPCQEVPNGTDLEQVWDLEATCDANGDHKDQSADWFKLWCGGACVQGTTGNPPTSTPPNGPPTAKYAPELTCKKCSTK